MLVKVHKSYREVVAICDSELLGKKFEEGVKLLNVRENFYNGEELNKEETIKKIKFHAKEDATFNIVGKESIDAAIQAGIINEDSVGTIKDIPYALKLL